jgi:tRNA-dihydrouridine synthase A
MADSVPCPMVVIMYQNSLTTSGKILAVAPMMDWTDRHCRYFHRLLSGRALLYTEMVVADALIHGDVARHLKHCTAEHPLALQLGGSDPGKLAHAAEIARPWGFSEINLNVGCPSDRVQSGTFGACLMRQPDLVADCVSALRNSVDLPVTVKCRIGVDDQDPEIALFDLAHKVAEAGSHALWVHARKAWLQGLSPKANRDIPPLDYGIVGRLKTAFPDMFIGINGGIKTAKQGLDLMQNCGPIALDGVMIGRAAYQNPPMLLDVDRVIYGEKTSLANMDSICRDMMTYTAGHLAKGGKVHHVTRHMIGLFQGQPGARRYRQILSVEASRAGADETIIEEAFQAVDQSANAA